jgi:S-adenosylmethionine hydrolase
MKGVILSRLAERGVPASSATIIDIAHEIPAQDLTAAALTVRGACPFYPPGTIHVVVVDPGVGSDRRLLAGRFGGCVYLAPDNGVLTLLARDFPPTECVEIRQRSLFRPSVSRTFHGRDILAPVAAALAAGAALSDLGPPAGEIIALDLPEPVREGGGRIVGTVLATDRYGNLITDIPESWLAGVPTGRPEAFRMKIGPCLIRGLASAYADAAPGEPLAIIGSFGLLEAAANSGNLAEELRAGPGVGVEVVLTPEG